MNRIITRTSLAAAMAWAMCSADAFAQAELSTMPELDEIGDPGGRAGDVLEPVKTDRPTPSERRQYVITLLFEKGEVRLDEGWTVDMPHASAGFATGRYFYVAESDGRVVDQGTFDDPRIGHGSFFGDEEGVERGHSVVESEAGSLQIGITADAPIEKIELALWRVDESFPHDTPIDEKGLAQLRESGEQLALFGGDELSETLRD